MNPLEGFCIEATYIPKTGEIRDPWKERLEYRVKVTYHGKEILETPYHTGIGHIPGYRNHQKRNWENQQYFAHALRTGRTPMPNGKPILPALEDVISCLVLDSSALDYPDYESWAGEFGYDPDSREGERTYRTCLDLALRLRSRLGESKLQELREWAAEL